LNMNSNIDKRLLVFIPSFISSAQQERENKWIR
jgi:hypothetical protein